MTQTSLPDMDGVNLFNILGLAQGYPQIKQPPTLPEYLRLSEIKLPNDGNI